MPLCEADCGRACTEIDSPVNALNVRRMSAIHVALLVPNVDRQATTSASGVMSRSRRSHRHSRAICSTWASPSAAVSCFEMDVASTFVAHFSGIEGPRAGWSATPP
jgi:hypothetical protein